MLSECQNQDLIKAKSVLKKHRDKLLELPGCTGVGIGFKTIQDQETDVISILLFVKEKKNQLEKKHQIESQLDGVATDVVEQEEFGFELIATDPFDRFSQLLGGIAVTPWEAHPVWGSIGCFIRTTGDPNPARTIPAGDYLLTCEHVLAAANRGGDTRIIQPNYTSGMVPPANYDCGNYVAGVLNPTADCAISTIAYGRTFKNEVPNYPWHPGRRTIKGVATAQPGQKVYKYGATTKFTEGVVAVVHYTPPGTAFQGTTLIRSKNGQNDPWVAKGDSGSVTLLQSNDYVIGLNFAGSPNAVMTNPPTDLPAFPAYYRGFCYDIQSQMDQFCALGGAVTLA